MRKILIVVDMQNDFVSGVLGNDETKSVLSRVTDKLRDHGEEYDRVYLTKDTHFSNYHKTIEGQRIPMHCFYGDGNGREICREIVDEMNTLSLKKPDLKFVEFIKETFGSKTMIENLQYYYEAINDQRDYNERFSYEFELCGVCTDICVLSNAIMLRNAFPDAIIKIDADCCAGTSVEAHNAALKVMGSCLIDIV